MVKPIKKWWHSRPTRKGRDDLFRERVRSGSVGGPRPTRSLEPQLDETRPAAYPWTHEELRTDVYGWGYQEPVRWYSTNSSNTTYYDITINNGRWYNSSSIIPEWVGIQQREHAALRRERDLRRVYSLDPYLTGPVSTDSAGAAVARYVESIQRMDMRMRERAARHERQHDEKRAARAAAQVKAESLLLRMLDDEQRAMYERDRCFIVTSQHGRTYLIHRGRQHNLFLIASPQLVAEMQGQLTRNHRILELCVHLRDDVPNEDNILAQKLWLETNEDEFLRKANIWDWSAIAANRPLVSHENEAFDPRRCSPRAQRALRIQRHETESGLIVAA